jgi:SAM-dependent methyltransferase
MEPIYPPQYLPHGEVTTRLVNAVVDYLKPLSVLDVGCGPCSSVKNFINNGVTKVVGIDGDISLKTHPDVQPYIDNVFFVNLEEAAVIIGNGFDVVWSYEVAEHIFNVRNYLDTLTLNCRKYIVMTAAAPFQPGIHHINLQPREYWIENVEERGFRYDAELTETLKPNPIYERSYFNTNGMVFEKLT